MRVIPAVDVHGLLAFPPLVAALREAFAKDLAVVPVRHHHRVAIAGEADATLLLMPAWDDMEGANPPEPFLGVKVVAIHPGNARRSLPSISGAYLLMRGSTGEALAVIDGPALTLRRTAAASALAASYLARADAARLTMVGAGALAPHLIAAHASVRPISEVLVWNRNPEKAKQLAATFNEAHRDDPLPQGEQAGARLAAVRAVTDLEAAVRDADIVSCATLSPEPLVKGEWLKAGAHLDLVGAYKPTTRECDDAAAIRARIFVDTRAGAMEEAGDILIPLAAGLIGEGDVLGDLFDLCRGTVRGRVSEDEITLFKSVGTAIEDLAAAVQAFRLAAGQR